MFLITVKDVPLLANDCGEVTSAEGVDRGVLPGAPDDDAGMYLDSLTRGNAKWPPSNGMTSTTKVCFFELSMLMTPATRPHTAQTA